VNFGGTNYPKEWRDALTFVNENFPAEK